MKLTNRSAVPVYTISGSNTSRPLPEWIARKRKRSLKQDPDYANRVELLQDFEFEEASTCIRISEDGDWVVSTGTYKPQIHVHYLPNLSLSFSRHTNALNQTFLLLSSDYSKSLHLQTDRFLEFHTPQGCHYTTRIPRYGRDLKYDKRSTEALVPSTGLNANGLGEVFRLNLEVGRFMKGYEVDVGGDEHDSVDAGALQGGINVGSINTAAIAEDSHNLLAFGTSNGTVEFWDSRSRSRVGLLSPPSSPHSTDGTPEITSLQFHPSGLTLASGSSAGLIHQYDLRSPTPLLKKDQGYGFPIHTITFLTPPSNTSRTTHLSSEPKILSSDKRIIKLWDARDGTPWTSIEPAVDLNSVAWYPDSGMILTANEGRLQHSFFIPQLGPAPRWCSFLDNMVEELAEDPTDPSAFTSDRSAGQIYDNYKFVSQAELRALSLDHLVGTTSLLRPYMHGFFVAQELYEEARIIAEPELWHEQRQKSIRAKIDAERESRIRGSKKAAAVKVNKRLAARLLERDEKNARRKARRAIERGAADAEGQPDDAAAAAPQQERSTLLNDPRFSALFKDEDFAVDEESREFAALNPSTQTGGTRRSSSASASPPPTGLTAVEEEENDRAARRGSSEEQSASEEEEERRRRAPVQKAKGRSAPRPPKMRVSASGSAAQGRPRQRDGARSFGARAKETEGQRRKQEARKNGGETVVGERAITFTPSSSAQGKRKQQLQRQGGDVDQGSRGGGRRTQDRRSASGNVMRRL